MKKNNTTGMLLVSILSVFLMIVLIGCGGSSNVPEVKKTDDGNTEMEGVKHRAVMVDAGATAITGWEKTRYERYSFYLPKDWKDGGVDGAWCPADQDTTMGLPKVSLYVGSIPPIMSGDSIDEKLKFYYHAVPTNIGNVRKCGMDGMFIDVTVEGYKHRGLILIDKSAMTVVDFLDCRAPEEDFSRYEETFKKILDSVSCD